MIQSSPKWPISAQMDRDKVDKKSVLRTWPSNCHKELFFALHLSFIMKKLQVKRKSRSSPLSSSHRAATVTALDAGVGRIHQSLQRFRYFHPHFSLRRAFKGSDISKSYFPDTYIVAIHVYCTWFWGIISLFSKVIKKNQRTAEHTSNRVINPSKASCSW